jgi:hypothetical protein
LRWQLPLSVWPLAVERATLTIDGNIPSRELTVFAIRNGEAVLVEQRSSPSGQIQIAFDDSMQLTPDAEGGLLMEIRVSELSGAIDPAASSTSTWSIRSTALDVWGTTLPEQAEATR